MGRSRWVSRVFHPPIPDDRTRDIYPLPSLEVEELRDRRVCRAVAKRIHLRAEIARSTNRVIAALNSLFSGRRAGPPAGVVSSLDRLPLNQRLAISEIIQAVKRLGQPPMHVKGQEAPRRFGRPAPHMNFRELAWEMWCRFVYASSHFQRNVWLV